MGGRGAFLPQGGFSEPLKYQEVEKIEGVKVLRFTLTGSQKLPERANTADAYIAYDQNGQPKQLRVFEKRIPVIDVDFGHSHHHGLSKDDFHVHEYMNGVRGNVSRALTLAEWARWGKVIEKIQEERK
ncbi:MAG: hypothetical protein IJ387_07575 [Thermoguttaceae bacterium]|nr:hypothetical protein [Thermoguttaceae bacterium]